MDIENDTFLNLAERIADSFMEIDSDICRDLRENNAEYIQMWRESAKLHEDFPIIREIMDCEDEIRLSVEEHKARTDFLLLKNYMENFERRQIYFRGHTDNFAYMRRIGAFSQKCN
jgi:hypothetical protein